MPITNETATVAASRYELRSDEVQEIMSKMPHWIVRRGIIVLLLLIAGLLAAAWFIHYPDIVVAKVNITSINPPVKLVAKSGGAIQQLKVGNQQEVTAEQIIAVMENPADVNQVQQLKKALLPLDTATSPDTWLNNSAQKLNLSKLGQLQSAYGDWLQAMSNYHFFRASQDYYNKKINQYNTQLSTVKLQKKILKTDSSFASKQLGIEAARLKRDSILLRQKVISPAEFEARNKDYISQQRGTTAAEGSLIQSNMSSIEYQKAITDLQQQQLKEENDRVQSIRDVTKRLLAQIDAWEQQFLIKSPVAGKIAFFKYWKENQVVNAGETIVTVVPPVQKYTARAFVQVQGVGKIKKEQKVLIKLDAYPFQEFGMLRGKVSFISSVALDSVFPMEISLNEGMVTVVHKSIPVQPEYSGTVEILTEDKNILQRVFEKIWISNRQ